MDALGHGDGVEDSETGIDAVNGGSRQGRIDSSVCEVRRIMQKKVAVSWLSEEYIAAPGPRRAALPGCR